MCVDVSIARWLRFLWVRARGRYPRIIWCVSLLLEEKSRPCFPWWPWRLELPPSVCKGSRWAESWPASVAVRMGLLWSQCICILPLEWLSSPLRCVTFIPWPHFPHPVQVDWEASAHAEKECLRVWSLPTVLTRAVLEPCEDLSSWEVVKEGKIGRLQVCQVRSLQVVGRWCPGVLCVHLHWRGGLAAALWGMCCPDAGREILRGWGWRGPSWGTGARRCLFGSSATTQP
jgi:hypothetical protein